MHIMSPEPQAKPPAQTRAAQEATLRHDPAMQRFAASRQAMAADPYRPLYHFVSPEGNLNDPNGLCFWQGQWHLFYQAFPPANPRPHWGHAVSADLIHWRDLPYALSPGPEEACWSGSTLVEEDRVIAMYHGHELGNMVAIAGDPLLLDWEKVTGTTVIPNPCPIWVPTQGGETMAGVGGSPVPAAAINFVYDPCIWKQGDYYYSLSGGILLAAPGRRRTRTQFLFRSPDLARWEYLHPFVEGDAYGLVGDDGGCPYFWPIADRHILLHFSHMSGAHYLLGDYDRTRQKFVVTYGGNFTFGPWYPGGVHAPTAAPDGHGGLIALFNVNVGKPTQGWNQIMSLPRRLTLTGKDTVAMTPAGDLESLRYDHRPVAAQALPANREVVLEGIGGKAIEINAEIDPGAAQMVELNVLRSPGKEEFTRIAFYPQRGYVDWDRSHGWAHFHQERDGLLVVDAAYSSELPDVTSRAPEIAPLYLAPGATLKLRVFVDQSIVEVFANDRQCATLRVYPGRQQSTGVSLRAQGADAALISLDAWQMRSIYP